ncbi:MAG TPA: hypothetical protein VMJ10_29610, partial [Kofleriaceae bacterium]|nr:hypothetical protein [Kofleriaceae bacterium]
MSNGNTALALTLGAGGGFLLWYVLRDRHHKQLAADTSAPAATPSSAPAERACSLRLDPTGLTVDGAKTNVADAVKRCQTAGRADVTIIKDAPAATYADLMVALGRAGVPIYAHRNSRGGRRLRRRGARDVDSVDLPAFADMVHELADQVDEEESPWGLARGRINDREILIAAIRRALADTEYRDLPRAAIDELLLRAQREGLVELACVESSDELDPDELRESEIVGPRYHAVVIAERARNDSPPVSTFTLALYPRGKDGPRRLTWYTSDSPISWEA